MRAQRGGRDTQGMPRVTGRAFLDASRLSEWDVTGAIPPGKRGGVQRRNVSWGDGAGDLGGRP